MLKIVKEDCVQLEKKAGKDRKPFFQIFGGIHSE